MTIKALGALTVLTLALAGRVQAQGTGTFEFGAFGQASYFDRTLHAEQAKGGPGALLGLFLTRHFELEGEAAFVPTDFGGDLHVYYIPLRARLLLNLPTGAHTAVFLGGATCTTSIATTWMRATTGSPPSPACGSAFAACRPSGSRHTWTTSPPRQRGRTTTPTGASSSA